MDIWKQGRKEGGRRGKEGRKEEKKGDSWQPRARKSFTSVCRVMNTQQKGKQHDIFKSLILFLYFKFKNGMSRDFLQSM